MTRRLLAFVLPISLGQALLAQPLTSTQVSAIDAVVEAEMKARHIPGVALGVVRNGVPILMKGYGKANLELDVPVTPKTMFRLASAGKQFVATAIMLLAEVGKLKLTDEVSKYFPGAPETWKGIQIKHLLSHTSGFARELPGWEPLKPYSDGALERMALQTKIDFPVGERHQYCNAGYFMLGLIINKASGKDWPIFIDERIFKAAGMAATRTTTLSEIVPNRASGYIWDSDKYRNDGLQLSIRTSGPVLTNIEDMAKLEAALIGGKVIGPKSFEAMIQPTPIAGGKTHPYGFGWSIGEFEGHRMIHHGGAQNGFRTEYARFIDDKLAIIVLANSGSAVPARIMEAVANVVLGS